MAAKSKTKKQNPKKNPKDKKEKAEKNDTAEHDTAEDNEPDAVNHKTIHFWRPYYLKQGPIKSKDIVFPLMSKTRCIPGRILPTAGRFRFIKIQHTGPHGLLDLPPVLTLKQRNCAIVTMEDDENKNKEETIIEKVKKGKDKKEKGKKSNKKNKKKK